MYLFLLGWYTLFPLFFQEDGIHHSFFYSVTSGSGTKPAKEGRMGCHGGGVQSFSPETKNCSAPLEKVRSRTVALSYRLPPDVELPRLGFHA